VSGPGSRNRRDSRRSRTPSRARSPRTGCPSVACVLPPARGGAQVPRGSADRAAGGGRRGRLETGGYLVFTNVDMFPTPKRSSAPFVSDLHRRLALLLRAQASRRPAGGPALRVSVAEGGRPRARGWLSRPPPRRGLRLSRRHSECIDSREGHRHRRRIDEVGVSATDRSPRRGTPRSQFPSFQRWDRLRRLFPGSREL
jgi:hypothetical protein